MRSVMSMLIGMLVWILAGGVGEVQAYDALKGFQGATIKGRIIFKGKVPPVESSSVRRDAKFCGESITHIPLVVDPDSHGVSGVVVSIDGMTTGKPLPELPAAQLENKECRFGPHTQATGVNATLEISSVDPVLHNTHLRINDKTFLNIALPPKGRLIRKTLKKPGRLDVRCDAHKFMQATIHVFVHPYFALTNQEGEFEMSDVPAGQYQLTFWHKVVGTIQKPITVPSSGEIALIVDLNESK